MTDISPDVQLACKSILERIQKNDIEVPVLPEVARKVVGIANNPESDAQQLANVIQSDQSLAANILRIANSPAYTAAGNIVSLQQAISRLGMQTLSEVAIAASVGSKLFDAPGFEERVQRIWDQSLRTALWSKELARITRRNVEAAFLCGLLHNIGRPMLLQWLSERYSDLSRSDMLSVEKRLYIEANKAVIRAWEFPSPVLQGISEFLVPIDKLTGTAQLVRAGMVLANWSLNPDNPLEETEGATELFATLHIYQTEVDQLKLIFNDVNASMDVMRA